jgi:hypothetical protein
MLTVAATPWLLFGFLPYNSYNLGVVAGGTAFLAIPQIVAWFLFVGLRTGRMPVRGGSEDRTASPTWFWITAAMYAALVALFLWFIIAVIFDLPGPPL